jgi:hypothetical protein
VDKSFLDELQLQLPQRSMDLAVQTVDIFRQPIVKFRSIMKQQFKERKPSLTSRMEPAGYLWV